MSSLTAKKISEEDNKRIWDNLNTLVDVSVKYSQEFYDLYFHESKKHSKTEKKEEHFDLSYNHIANQFHKVHDKLVILSKEVGPNKRYIETRNLQSKISLRKISSLFGSKR